MLCSRSALLLYSQPTWEEDAGIVPRRPRKGQSHGAQLPYSLRFWEVLCAGRSWKGPIRIIKSILGSSVIPSGGTQGDPIIRCQQCSSAGCCVCTPDLPLPSFRDPPHIPGHGPNVRQAEFGVPNGRALLEEGGHLIHTGTEDRRARLQDSSTATLTPVPATLLSPHPSPDPPSSIPLKAPTECALSTALFPSSPGIGATLGILAAPHTPTSSSH